MKKDDRVITSSQKGRRLSPASSAGAIGLLAAITARPIINVLVNAVPDFDRPF
jgi:hypothetical protein